MYDVFMCCQVRSGTGKVRDKHSESSAGYLSDGHMSSRSSDNESGSVCSEMVGREVNIASECSCSCLLFRLSLNRLLLYDSSFSSCDRCCSLCL